jgi:hypothetical protein
MEMVVAGLVGLLKTTILDGILGKLLLALWRGTCGLCRCRLFLASDKDRVLIRETHSRLRSIVACSDRYLDGYPPAGAE